MNYHTKFINFEVANFESAYHAILGRHAIAKFMVVPHYPYLLVKMLGPHGVLSLRGDLRHASQCDIEVVQIVAKVQVTNKKKEVIAIVKKLNLEELEILAKKTCILAPPKERNVKQIDLGTSDPSKTLTISAYLYEK